MKSGKLIARAFRLLEDHPQRPRITSTMIDDAIARAAHEFPPPSGTANESNPDKRRRRHKIVGRAVDLIRAQLANVA